MPPGDTSYNKKRQVTIKALTQSRRAAALSAAWIAATGCEANIASLRTYRGGFVKLDSSRSSR